jgi:hypothetical protein
MVARSKLGLGVALVVSACGSVRYSQPPVSSPHGNLHLTVIYHYQPSRDAVLDQRVAIDDQSIAASDSHDAAQQWARDLRVDPGAHALSFSARFERSEIAHVSERPQLPGCTPGLNSTAYALNDCIMQGGRQSTSKLEWVTEAECALEETFQIASQATANLELHFWANDRCELRPGSQP